MRPKFQTVRPFLQTVRPFLQTVRPTSPARPRSSTVGVTASPDGHAVLSAVPAILGAMTYDEGLAQRIREAVGDEPGLSEKGMFGGLAFLVHGNMAVSASGQGGLLLRVDPADTEMLVAEEHVGPMEMRGREMNGWLRVADEAVESDDDLRRWVDIGVAYARALPPKEVT